MAAKWWWESFEVSFEFPSTFSLISTYIHSHLRQGEWALRVKRETLPMIYTSWRFTVRLEVKYGSYLESFLNANESSEHSVYLSVVGGMRYE